MTAPAPRLAVLDTGPPAGLLLTWLDRSGFRLVDHADAVNAVLALGPGPQAPLLAAAERGVPVLLVGAEHPPSLWDAAGLLPGRVLPAHDVRVRPGRDAGEVGARLGGEDLVLHDCWPLQDKIGGGAVYDWGSHYLDWVLDLLPQPVEWVSATAHKMQAA